MKNIMKITKKKHFFDQDSVYDRPLQDSNKSVECDFVFKLKRFQKPVLYLLWKRIIIDLSIFNHQRESVKS